jgi:hypothetical protein
MNENSTFLAIQGWQVYEMDLDLPPPAPLLSYFINRYDPDEVIYRHQEGPRIGTFCKEYYRPSLNRYRKISWNELPEEFMNGFLKIVFNE